MAGLFRSKSLTETGKGLNTVYSNMVSVRVGICTRSRAAWRGITDQWSREKNLLRGKKLHLGNKQEAYVRLVGKDRPGKGVCPHL